MIIGVDPGFSGGVAILDGKRLTVMPMPILRVRKKRGYDLEAIVSLLAKSKADLVAVEAVTRPGSLVGCGMFWQGAAMALAMDVVRPNPKVWKGFYGLSADKAESIAKCHELYPQTKGAITRKGQDGLAEAVLIAHYARETQR